MTTVLDYLWKPRAKAAVLFVLVTLIFMLFLFPRAARLSGSEGNRVVDLQLAFTTAQFESVLTTWSQTSDRAVELVKTENIQKLDFLFPAAYSFALVLSFAALAGGRSRTRWTTVCLLLPFMAALLDYAENLTHLYLLSGIDTRAQVELAVSNHTFNPILIFLAASFAVVKYLLLGISGLAVGTEAGRRLLRPSPTGGSLDFRDVLKAELEYVLRRRFADQSPRRVKDTLVGLALSGGGIRSATTCLGMLQALARLNILPLVDYMCTVSGGGYIGSCLSSLLTLDQSGKAIVQGGQPQFTTSWEQFPFNPQPGGPGAAQIRHLRTHGSFLLTRKGVLKRETLRSVGQLLSGTVYHLVLAALVLTSIALLYMTLLFFVSPGVHNLLRVVTAPLPTQTTAFESTRESGDLPKYVGESFKDVTSPGQPSYKIPVSYEYPSLWERIKAKTGIVASAIWSLLEGTPWRTTLAASAGVGLLVALGAFAYLYQYRRIKPSLTTRTPKAGESAEEALSTHVLRLAGYGSLVVILFALVLIVYLAKPAAPLLLLLPIVLIGSLRLTSWLLHVGLPRMAGAWTRDMRSFWSAYQATADYALWTVTLLGATPVLVYALREHDTWTALTGLGSLAVARMLTSRKEIDAKKRPLSASALRWALALTIGIGLVLIVVSICTVLVPDSPDPSREQVLWNMGWGAVGTALLLMVLAIVGDSNRLSPHYFYRDRLAEAYLYTDRPRAGKTSLECLRDSLELLLSHLHYGEGPPARTTAPLHLIGTAVNLAGSRDLTRKDRKSGYFLFSKFFCGSRHTGFRPTEKYAGGDVKLARAVTISGAAASSGIGGGTFFAQAFATVLFNLRLGYWMPNPAKLSSVRQSINDRWHFWPKWLWREVTMRTDERHSLVNLSDGGHTGDNVGIYPLLQRRCKLIIACDAECDASLTFGSFTEALRHAYIDLGIDVDIDLTMLRPDKETGLSRSHSAVGLIRYPAASGQERQVGYLVYLKNSLTGDEPEPVLNYKSNNAPFPHESTADQFFDDDQFESYRALGVHIAEHAFAQWVHGAPFERWQQAAKPAARTTY